MPTKELQEPGLPGLLPLLVLTREGARREVVEEIIAALAPPSEEPKADLLSLTYGLASLAFNNEEDQEWLIWRFSMLDDILLETRAFQEVRKKALEEGREEGREEGIQGMRDALISFVQARFSDPKLTRLARSQVDIINDLAILKDLLIKIGMAQTLEEVQKLLIDWSEPDDGDD